uniref:Ketoreductase (KR) domain-containing protein n=1 Tax=Arion vulgaris TaxID=1028688 RepID=A0A0B6ZPP2_9EUPU
MWGWIALAVFIVFIIILYMLSPLISPLPVKLHDAHVLITGGSSGIGKALAIQAVQQGSRVTLVARSKKKLEEARAEVLLMLPSKTKSSKYKLFL